jgi:hypothetical protein
MEHLEKYASKFTSVKINNINFKKNIGTDFNLIPSKTMLKLVFIKESRRIKYLEGQNKFPQIVASVLGDIKGICFFSGYKPCTLTVKEFICYHFIDAILSIEAGELGLTRTHHDDISLWSKNDKIFNHPSWTKKIN